MNRRRNRIPNLSHQEAVDPDPGEAAVDEGFEEPGFALPANGQGSELGTLMGSRQRVAFERLGS